MKRWLPMIVAISGFVIDRVMKALVLSGRDWQLGPIHIGLFRNTGLVFSLPAPYWLAVTLMVAALILIGLAIWRSRRENKLFWPLLLLVVGAVSNLYDRIVNGFIVDYVYATDWLPIINLADVMLTVAVLMLLIRGRVVDKQTTN
jgi:signal peptidase II